MKDYKIRVANEAESKEAQELFLGIGVRGFKYKTRDGENQKKEYRLWSNMMKRCYSDWFKKNRPAYSGCCVSDNFKNYEYFFEWCSDQKGFGVDGFELDKDLLIKGNRKYGEDSCVFLPKEINKALILRKSKRGEHPIGVTFSRRDKLYLSTLTMFGRNTNVGYFKDSDSAFKKYKEVKELYLKSLAGMYRGVIDARAYDAIMNYEVCIND